MKNKQYWIERAEQVLKENERSTNEYLNKLNLTYHQTVQAIDRDIEKIFTTYKKDFSEEQAKAWLDEIIPKYEYEKLLAKYDLIEDEKLKKRMLMKLNAPAYRYRINRLEQIRATILPRLSESARAEQNLSEHCYKEALQHSYNRTMFDIQQGVGIAFQFNSLPSKTIESLVQAKWLGGNFSSRVWNNTTLVADKASEVIKEGVLSGQSIDQMSKSLMDRTYTQSMFNATRLIRTEVNYFSNKGAFESYKEAELDSYEFCATLDSRTSNICQSFDGNVFPIDEAIQGENAPPMHPYCRSCIIPIIDSEGIVRMDKRRARDIVTGKSITISNMNYREWQRSLHKITKDSYLKILGTKAVTGIEITGISEHLVDRIIERKISYKSLYNALINPLKVGKIKVKENGKSQEFIGEQARAIINPDTGNIITVWQTSSKLRKKLKR